MATAQEQYVRRSWRSQTELERTGSCVQQTLFVVWVQWTAARSKPSATSLMRSCSDRPCGQTQAATG